jgi:tripartite-type tricarboxylate transporter receptor subunit TctC
MLGILGALEEGESPLGTVNRERRVDTQHLGRFRTGLIEAPQLRETGGQPEMAFPHTWGFSVSQHLFSNLRHDPAAFVPITVIATVPNVLVVRPGLSASSVQELIALAKSQPGKLWLTEFGGGALARIRAGVD